MNDARSHSPRTSWRLATIAALGLALTLGSTVTPQVHAADSEYQDVPFNVLSGFDYDLPDPLDPTAKLNPNQVPAKVKALNGRKVSVRGFMLPFDVQPDGVTQFMLNASLDMCYFGAPVRMNEWIMVAMKPGKKAAFSHMAYQVNGVLEVGEQLKDGRVQSLYRITADSAEIAK
jgi:hypothetical protein